MKTRFILFSIYEYFCIFLFEIFDLIKICKKMFFFLMVHKIYSLFFSSDRKIFKNFYNVSGILLIKFLHKIPLKKFLKIIIKKSLENSLKYFKKVLQTTSQIKKKKSSKWA